MEKKEKREFLKPFRCVGGFILFTTVFTEVFSLMLIVLTIFTDAIFGEGYVSNIVSELFLYGAIIYSYYVGYRIFFKKYLNQLCDLGTITKNKRTKSILQIIIAFILVRFCWIIWMHFLDLIGYNPITNQNDNKIYLIGILYVTIIAPIIEEIIFRGWMLKVLKKYGTVTAIIISSLTFGIFHGTVYQSIPTIFIGIILAILTIKSKSLIPSMIVHLCSNTLSVLQEYINISNIMLEQLFSIIIVVISLVIIIYLIITNIKKILNYLKKIINSLTLIPTSISYVLFLLIYVSIIVFDFLNGMYHLME